MCVPKRARLCVTVRWRADCLALSARCIRPPSLDYSSRRRSLLSAVCLPTALRTPPLARLRRGRTSQTSCGRQQAASRLRFRSLEPRSRPPGAWSSFPSATLPRLDPSSSRLHHFDTTFPPLACPFLRVRLACLRHHPVRRLAIDVSRALPTRRKQACQALPVAFLRQLSRSAGRHRQRHLSSTRLSRSKSHHPYRHRRAPRRSAQPRVEAVSRACRRRRRSHQLLAARRPAAFSHHSPTSASSNLTMFRPRGPFTRKGTLPKAQVEGMVSQRCSATR